MNCKIQKKSGQPGVLNSQLRDFLDSLPSQEVPITELSMEEIRTTPSPAVSFNLPPAPVNVENISVAVRDGASIAVRIYRKSVDQKAPALLYSHGGGWIFCNLDTHDAMCRPVVLRFWFYCFFSGLPLGSRK